MWTISLTGKSIKSCIPFHATETGITCTLFYFQYVVSNLFLIYFIVFFKLIPHYSFSKWHSIIVNLLFDFPHFGLYLFFKSLIQVIPLTPFILLFFLLLTKMNLSLQLWIYSTSCLIHKPSNSILPIILNSHIINPFNFEFLIFLGCTTSLNLLKC